MFNVWGTFKIFYVLNFAILLFSNSLPLVLSKYIQFYRVKMFLQWFIQVRKLKNFPKIQDFLLFSIFRGVKINYFGLYSACFKFFVICTLPTQGSTKINFQLIRKKQVIRPEKWEIFFKLPTRPGKIFFRKIKANKMRIISKQYLGICGLVSR